MSVHLRHALAWPSVLFLDPVSPVSPTVTYTVCYCTPLWRWSPYRVDSMLHSQTPHQRRKNLDYIKVCSLTWGWAESLGGVCALKCLHIFACRTPYLHGSKLYLYRACGHQRSFSSLWALNRNVSFMCTCWSHWCCHQAARWGLQLRILTWPIHFKGLKPTALWIRFSTIQLTCGPGFPLWCGHLGWGVRAFSCLLWSILPT